MVRYQKYFCEKDRHDAIRRNKTKYMLNKSWICPTCSHDYSLAGKWCHIKTQKHKKMLKLWITDTKNSITTKI